MRIHGYTCPDCKEYHRTTVGVGILNVGIQIRCDECGAVETIEPLRGPFSPQRQAVVQ